MNWLYNFKDYCEANGLQLLPEDMRYLDKMLRKISVCDRRDVAHKYYNVWVRNMALAPTRGMAMNYGRRRANEYLTEECEKK